VGHPTFKRRCLWHPRNTLIGFPEPTQDCVPASDHRDKLPAGYRVVKTSMLGGLHHEYRLVKGARPLNTGFCFCGRQADGLATLHRVLRSNQTPSRLIPKSPEISLDLPALPDIKAHEIVEFQAALLPQVVVLRPYDSLGSLAGSV
jgi:hypothetical protein